MVSRFLTFTDRERDLIRMALRRFYDDIEKAILSDIADDDEKSFEISILLYELSNHIAK